jgi:hypothetical protein
VKPEPEQQMAEAKHFDFAGQEISEIYDEWALKSSLLWWCPVTTKYI